MRISDWSSDVCSSDLVIDDIVQQVALMAHHHHRRPIGAEEGFQPQRRFQVEVAGRLVQQQQVRLGKQQRRQRDAHPPSAGKAVERPVLHLLVKAEADQYPRRPRGRGMRTGEHTSELQSLMRISYAVFCLKKKTDFFKTINENNTSKSLR